DELRVAPATRTEFRNIPLRTNDGLNLRHAIEQRIDERIGWFRDDQTQHSRLGRFWVLGPDDERELRTPLLQPQSLPGYERHVRVLDGRLPEPVPAGEPIELAISARSAQVSGIKPGTTVTLVEDFDTCERELPRDDRPPPPPCTPRAGLSYSFPVVITGVIEPVNPEDNFWIVNVARYFDPERLIPDAGPIIPAFADESALLDGIGSVLPGYRADTAWHTFADPERLNRSNFDRAREDLRALYREFEPLGGFAFSPLASTFEEFGRDVRYQQTPLTVLLIEIACIALFYVALISSIVVERQADEITLLRSRGASTLQIAGIYLLEGLTLGAIAILVAPFLASMGTAVLGLTPTFERVTDGALLPVTIPPMSFALAALGALLSLVALVLPAFVVARRGAMSHRRAQSRSGASLIQRYYLDLVFVALAALLLWELRERGSAFQPSATGGVASDPLLLISPALIIVAAALLILRFYPIVLNIAARLLSATAGVTVAVGLWQVVRRPGQYTRLALLLMMAVAIGTFAASYASTAERSFRDRAAYEVGVDLRASGTGDLAFSGTTGELEEELGTFPGVTRASAVLRTNGRLATPGGSSRDVQILGVDPSAVGEMLWFRDDFARRPLPDLLAELGTAGALRGKPLSGDPDRLSIWVDPGPGRDNITMWARVRDSEGRFALLEFGKLDFQGWRQLSTPIRPEFGTDLTAPLSLTAIVLTEPSTVVNTSTAPIFIDDVTATAADGSESAVEGFEGTVEWTALPNRQTIQDAFRITGDNPHSGRSSGQFAFRTGASSGVRGIYVQDPNVPLPALVSSSFSGATGLGPGAQTMIQAGDALIPIVIRDTFDLFPTLSVSNGPAVVVNRDLLIAWVNSFVDSSVRRPTEVWFSLQPDTDRAALATALASPEYRLTAVLDREEALQSIERNPLIAAGGSGILFVAFLAVLVLVGAALLVSLWMAVQRRRVEFAVLRALGLSKGQVFRMLAFEYALVVVLGIVAGAYLGLVVGRQMLSFLNVTEDGNRVVPPFILQTDWTVVAAGVADVLVIFGAALLLAVRVLAGSTDAQALRTE
ncbi:MAG: FtsX-like permease family protein, partial [Dehalococcoidia bacterium]